MVSHPDYGLAEWPICAFPDGGIREEMNMELIGLMPFGALSSFAYRAYASDGWSI